MSPLLRGIGHVAQQFGMWAASADAAEAWVEAPSRNDLVLAIRKFLKADSDQPDLHIEGVSGIGKSRVVLEALRGQDIEPLVAYVYAADTLNPTLINQLQVQHRYIVLIVDECDAKRHSVIAKQLRFGSQIKLITIGEPVAYRGTAVVLTVGPLENEAIRTVLRQGATGLRPEHAHFVVDASGGNVRLAQLLAQQIARQPNITASELIDHDIIATYISAALPTGREFLACCALALLPSFGYEGAPSAELAWLASTLELELIDLQAAIRSLDDLGLLRQQGRYRSIAPHPLAIFLAVRAWADHHQRVLVGLTATEDISIAIRLFQRAAECGDNPAIRRVIQQTLEEDGPYAHIDIWDKSTGGTLIEYAAPIAPHSVLRRIESALAETVDSEVPEIFRGQHSIRSILEKLAWRSTTFRRAANALLRIAAAGGSDLATLESAATTHSWTDLFGTLLPTTAASPTQRMRYLTDVARTSETRHRLLAVLGAKRALSQHEQAIEFAELQAGVVVEQRGMPATWDDAATYQAAAIDLLGGLTKDADAEISGTAIKAVLDAIHPLLRHEKLLGRLTNVLRDFPDDGLLATRAKIIHLEGLFERTASDDALIQGLARLSASLPNLTPLETLTSLVSMDPWDLAGNLEERIREAVNHLPLDQRVPRLLSEIDRKPRTAHQLGRILAGLTQPGEHLIRHLAVTAASDRFALIGYLQVRVDKGDEDIFDEFLESEVADHLDALVRLQVSAAGPISETAWIRAISLAKCLSPAAGARSLSQGWIFKIDTNQLQELLAEWLPRIESIDDYNAVLEFATFGLQSRAAWIETLDSLIAELVALRSRFGRLATAADWEWRQLAIRQLPVQPLELLHTLLDVVESGELFTLSGPDGPGIIREATAAAGAAGWRHFMSRLQGGTWRMRNIAGPWLVDAVTTETIASWIGDNLERAHIVAAIAPLGGKEISGIVRFLVAKFGADRKVTVALRGSLVPIAFYNSESNLYDQLIEQAQGWSLEGDEPAIERWVHETLDWLEAARTTAIENDRE